MRFANRSLTTAFSIGIFLALATPAFAQDAPAAKKLAGYHLVENFTRPLGTSPTVVATAVRKDAKAGLASARVQYKMTDQLKRADLQLSDRQSVVDGPGILHLWVKGDGSGNQLSLVLRQVEAYYDAKGIRRYRKQLDHVLQQFNTQLGEVVDTPFLLDFTGWREATFDAGVVSGNKSVITWWQRLQIVAPNKPEAKLAGTIWLDEMLVVPKAGAPTPTSTFVAGLLGPTVRDYDPNVALYLDVRSFVESKARVSARVTMTDRNDNLVVDRDFDFDLKAGDSKEALLELKPDAFSSYLPPFKITGDLISAELPQVDKKFDYTMVMGNVQTMFDDMSNIYGRWHTAAYGLNRPLDAGWANSWTHGEGQRCSPFADTKLAISRVNLGKPAANVKHPPGRFAMKVDYHGDAAVYVGHDRFFTGNAYKAGFWIKGNGSKARVEATFLDYSNLGSFWNRGWARLFTGTGFASGARVLCTLESTDWQYVEVPLPGNGLGTNLPTGSTLEIDFPIELTAVRVIPEKSAPAKAGEAPTSVKTSGSFLMGPMFVTTQAPVADALSVHLGYDDVNHQYNAKHGATITVHNGWRVGTRHIKAVWTLLDRNDNPVKGVFGTNTLDVAGGSAISFRADLAQHAARITPTAGPYRLEVIVADTQDVAVSARRSISLSRPNSVALLSGFESDRGYLGLQKAEGLPNPTPPGESTANTSTAQKHSGQRSLAIAWDKQTAPTKFVSVDPPVAGIPTSISLWVYGDGAGAWFYPLIGDKFGVSHGVESRQWDFFFPRLRGANPSATGTNTAVQVDWTGWRQLIFDLPPVPTRWKERTIVGWLPDYPLGVHLVVIGNNAKTDRGTIYVDDITLQTQLKPDERIVVRRDHGDSNVLAANQAVRFELFNFDASRKRSTRVVASILDWRDRPIAKLDKVHDLAAKERRAIELAKSLPPGAYGLRIELHDPVPANATSKKPNDSSVPPAKQVLVEDLLVANLAPVLGSQSSDALKTDWKLRGPIRSRFMYVDEDWDWIEFHPGNFQFDTLRKRAAAARERDADPFMLLGFSAYYAAGVGFEQMKAGAFSRRQRDIGHAVDTFLVPKRIEDWDNYTGELMRNVGREIAGWVVWDNPDGTSSLKVKPAKFAEMLTVANKWRKVYCPETPLIIGGMRPETALGYLQQLHEVKRNAAADAYLKSLKMSAPELKRLMQQLRKPARGATKKVTTKTPSPLEQTGVNVEAGVASVVLPEQNAAALTSKAVEDIKNQIALIKQKSYPLDMFTGINLRMDVGRLSPEDAEIVNTIETFQRAINYPGQPPKSILLTDLDWAVEKRGTNGPDAFDQAAYLVRSDLLLHRFGIRPVLDVRNQDEERLGLGLVYRRSRSIPPIQQNLPTWQFKPGWWAVTRVRRLLDETDLVAEIPIQDVIAGKSRMMVLKRKDNGKHLAIVWRNNDAGYVSFAPAGVTVASAQDIFGSVVKKEDNRFAVGKVPVVFDLAAIPGSNTSLLALCHVDDGSQPAWYQRVLARFHPGQTAGPMSGSSHKSGQVVDYHGDTVTGRKISGKMLSFANGGSERFEIKVPQGSGLILRKRYLLDNAGQSARVLINGKPVGDSANWDLKRNEPDLRTGIRESVFVIDGKQIGTTSPTKVEIRYEGTANTIEWTAFALSGGNFPLNAVGPIHADQRVRTPRLNRNMIGSGLRIGHDEFANGIGCFSPSLLEYALNGQFARFTAKAGIDAATDGRGSVVFEVYGDGKKLWNSNVLSGLDAAVDIDVSVKGVNRLRLVITDAKDGNRFDAANWCDPVLVRN